MLGENIKYVVKTLSHEPWTWFWFANEVCHLEIFVWSGKDIDVCVKKFGFQMSWKLKTKETTRNELSFRCNFTDNLDWDHML